MADCLHVLEEWDWENIFTSSLLEHDLPWHGELSEPVSMKAAATPSHASIHVSVPSSTIPVNFTNSQLSVKSGKEADDLGTPSDVIATNTSDGSLDSSGYNHDTAVSSHHMPSFETSLINPPAARYSKKKKRDPRLDCPNFLAGRIPCSCPEEDELEADIEVEPLVKKRSKVGARCQVPTCGEDIGHLKGYHQRHRVCLECANSPKVMLKDLPHRYCQQCGKFHRLSDFDEGKRSCRRKLERHNRRRRRRLVDEEGEAQDCEARSLGIDIDNSNLQEGAAILNAQTVVTSTKRSQGMTRAKQKTKGESIFQDVTPLLPTDDQCANDDSSGSVQRFEEDINSSNKRNLDEHCPLNVLLENGNEHIEEGSRSLKHTLKVVPGTSYASIGQWKHTDYVSPCPTGRISFKLYDWNPADFPRRLRQQIFDWLANMPVELESYIRSGCIILTFFVTMPQVMWDKVLAEWKGQVQTFILKSGVKLVGTGQLSMPLVEKSLVLKDGKATSAFCKDLLAPFVVDLYPRSLEAGCHTQIYVFGFNFSGGRFLLSFGEQYVECSDWESVDRSHFTAHKIWNSLGNIEVQKVNVFLPDSETFGPAFAEVESVHGLSNFVPVLVADKSICSEINTVRLNYISSASSNICVKSLGKDVKALRSQFGMDILTDLGWALKYITRPLPVDKFELREALIDRLQTLHLFSLEHRCHAVARLVQTAVGNFIQGGNVRNTPEMLKGMKALNISGRLHFSKGTAVKGQLTPRSAADDDSIQAVDKPNKIKGLQGPKCAQQQVHLTRRSELAEGGHDSKMDILPIEEPLLEERISISEEGWNLKACWALSSSWQRKPATGTSTLCTSNKKVTRILVTAVAVVTVCTGMCFMLQHPHEVAEMSMSLRRCLWGSNDLTHV
ncbi:hypothetical protein GOP47_0025561 [Adiantum capillus-veneris]|uniref:SBP-type domain-containing protein n=1 Tax=Adiantum capillus-veneris TaxID=13818 RepID=A0A9D4Z3N5_ADICA|nr:hypothetical protein GOP47_0025561 [Adiantum capillus-veneris]